MSFTIALVMLAAGAADAPQTAISVARGEDVVATLADGEPLAITLVSRTPATPSPYERHAGETLRTEAFAEASGATSKPLETGAEAMPPPIEDDQLHLRFTPVAGDPEGTMLLIQNGYTRALRYRARITLGDRSAPTDVCLVIPRFGSVEFWPDRLDSIELYDLAFVAWKNGDSTPCG